MAFGYGRELQRTHLLSGYALLLSGQERAYGVNYKYFFNASSTIEDAWFASGQAQSGGVSAGDFKELTLVSGSGGYQWTYELPVAITLEAGANANDLGDTYLTLVKFNLAYLF